MSYTQNDGQSTFNVLEPSVVRIDRVVEESGTAKSFFFKGKIEYQPGQFIMLWIPGLDEKPFSLSYHGDDFFGITVARRGKFTLRLHQMQAGEIVGVRGPFGRPFTIEKGNACIIGGGVGMATLAVLIDKLKRGMIIQGAKTASDVLYRDREKFGGMMIYTEDGSAGAKGLPTDRLEALYKQFGVMNLYACGPEPMMYKVFTFAQKYGLPMQASLERYMKCGIGLCGQCSCDGLRVCVDGPVMDRETLAGLSDFGRFARLRDGRKVAIEEYIGTRTMT